MAVSVANSQPQNPRFKIPDLIPANFLEFACPPHVFSSGFSGFHPLPKRPE